MQLICRSSMAALLFSSSVAVSAFAHEGHGHTPNGQGETATHYFTEPVHQLQFAAIAGFVFVVGWMLLRRYLHRTNSVVSK